ncbi:hypothetical protein TNCV_1416971 [Trichonephila clavipes]|nr:hypothetical protein TNCV_1416971 [Trichonephila clavipes]
MQVKEKKFSSGSLGSADAARPKQVTVTHPGTNKAKRTSKKKGSIQADLSLSNGGYNLPFWIRRRPGEETESEELAVAVVACVEEWMVLLEMAVDGLRTCVFCVDVDVTFRGRPLFRSGATEVSVSLKGVKAEVYGK